jgi:hypothetical protein
MYSIKAETIIQGDIGVVWDTVTDVNHWTDWDPHEQEARLDGPFMTGAIGWSKPRKGPGTAWVITKVVEKQQWASECKLPGGKLSGESTFELLEDGRIHCTKNMSVTGPLVPLFRFYFGRHIRHDMFATWTALEREATRRLKVSSPHSL